MKKAKSDLEEAVSAISEKEEALKAAQTQLEEANEVIAGYKMKEEEMARKEKALKRKASLVEAGLEDDAASAAVEKFENLDDEAFDSMTSLFAAMKTSEMKKEEEEAMMQKKKIASEDESVEEAESALEEVEAEETVDLSVGSDESETESAEASVRSELVEFVSARLGKTSK
jgi:multidrug resistance efflux pump